MSGIDLPGADALAKLANEFFAAWPGATPAGAIPNAAGGVAPADPQPAGATLPPSAVGPSTPAAVPAGALPPGANLVPHTPQAPADVAAQSPKLLPHAEAGNRLPDVALTALPGYDGRAGSHALGAASGSTDWLAAQPFALPGTEALGTRLFFDESPREPVPGSAPASSFYFLDPAEVPRLDAHQAQPATPGAAGFDVNGVRRDFPILSERVNGRPLIWFDNAATTQKPRAVIERLAYFYEHENSNIHRAAHELAARATDAYEGAREIVRRFIGARETEEIVFVRGTTEAINLVAKSWGAANVKEGDEIIVSHLEHHANIVPWQQLCAATGAKLRVIPVDDAGQVRLDPYHRMLGEKTKIVAVTQVSNALGTVVPVEEIVAAARAAGAATLVDGAQSVAHMRVNVQALGADFFVFSGHKIFGPTGIGALYGRREVLEAMPPWQGGGNMIADVTFERTAYHGAPTRFEAGTGNIADAVGLGAALEYVERVGIDAIAAYEHSLVEYATHRMAEVRGLKPIGTVPGKASVLSFVLDGYTTDEVGQAFNREGIAVRTGHHCAQPILRRYGLEATVRPSLAFYNTCAEIDCMVAVLHRLAGARR